MGSKMETHGREEKLLATKDILMNMLHHYQQGTCVPWQHRVTVVQWYSTVVHSTIGGLNTKRNKT